MQLKNPHWGAAHCKSKDFCENLTDACMNNLSPHSRRYTWCVHSPVSVHSQKAQHFLTAGSITFCCDTMSKYRNCISPRPRNSKRILLFLRFEQQEDILIMLWLIMFWNHDLLITSTLALFQIQWLKDCMKSIQTMSPAALFNKRTAIT